MNPLPASTADTLRADVEAIALPEGRMTGTPGHQRAQRTLAKRLAEAGCQPYSGNSYSLPYRVGGQAFVNLLGVVPGTAPAGKAPLLVGAHYDSVIAAPSADDNAAAVAIALEVASRLTRTRALKRDVIIALFDAEEPPHFLGASMGSIRFYEDQLDARGIHAAIIMDLVGHDVPIDAGQLMALINRGGPSNARPAARARAALPPLQELLFITGSESHPELPGIVDASPHPAGLRLAAGANSYVGDMSDHAVFRREGVPYFFLSCGHWPHYHRPTDTPDRLNYQKMAATVALVEGLLGQLDRAPLKPGAKPADTVAFEARYLRSALGPEVMAVLETHLQLDGLRTRRDLDALVGWLRGTGL